jgi:hypothetical protein
MRCQLYLMAEGARPIRLGPFETVDDAHARGLALVEMDRRPHVRAIDIWCDSGELFRVERPAGAGLAGALGGAEIAAGLERRLFL